jgi:hypothetical protein
MARRVRYKIIHFEAKMQPLRGVLALPEPFIPHQSCNLPNGCGCRSSSSFGMQDLASDVCAIVLGAGLSEGGA